MNSARGNWLPVFEFALFNWFVVRTDETEVAVLTMQLFFPPIEIWYGFKPPVSGGSERWRSWIRSNLSSIERGGDDSTPLCLFWYLGRESLPRPCPGVPWRVVLGFCLIKVLLMYFPPCLFLRSSGWSRRDYKWIDSHEWKSVLPFHRAT